MGIIRAGFRAVKAAAKGGDAATVASEAAKGFIPRSVERMGGGKAIDRAVKGIRDVQDSGRSGTFHESKEEDPWNVDTDLPKPPHPHDDPWAV